MQSDEPPYLCVGTEVSAKFKGAFCEAKIKKLAKSVRCKVTLKEAPFGSFVFDDKDVKGPIELNATVEVSHGKQIVRGVIAHIKDCSTYTVVFNDGDERMLRRTGMCLKGAKHFDAAQNLDALPLYNPEQFSTPVAVDSSYAKQAKKKTGSRKRRSSSADTTKIIPTKRPNRKRAISEDSDDDKNQRRKKRAAANAAAMAMAEIGASTEEAETETASTEEDETEDERDLKRRGKTANDDDRIMKKRKEEKDNEADKDLKEAQVKEKKDKERCAKYERPVVGAVVCVFSEPNLKGKWYPAIIITTEAYKQYSLKPRVITKSLVSCRSFQNGKFLAVHISHTSPYTTYVSKNQFEGNALKLAMERASRYIDKGILPPGWEQDHIHRSDRKNDEDKKKRKDETKEVLKSEKIDKIDKKEKKEKREQEKEAKEPKKEKEYKEKEKLADAETTKSKPGKDKDKRIRDRPRPDSDLIEKESERERKNEDNDKEKRVEKQPEKKKKIVERKKEKEPIKSDEDSSSDEEDYGEERDVFVAQLYKFQEERGTPINRAPVLGGKDIDLYRFYKVVQLYGGCKKVTDGGRWKKVLTKMKLEGCQGATTVTVKKAYQRYLLHFNSVYKTLGWNIDELSTSSISTPRNTKRASLDYSTVKRRHRTKKDDFNNINKKDEKNEIKTSGAVTIDEAKIPIRVSEEKEVKMESIDSGNIENKEITRKPVKEPDNKDIVERNDVLLTKNVEETNKDDLKKEPESAKKTEKKERFPKGKEKVDKDKKSDVEEEGVKKKALKERRKSQSRVDDSTVGTSNDNDEANCTDPYEGYYQATVLSHFYMGQKVRALHHGRWYDARVVTVKQPKLQEIVDTIQCTVEEDAAMPSDRIDILRQHVKNTRCFVHYLGWNSRYDEWIPLPKMRLSKKDYDNSLLRVKETGKVSSARLDWVLEWSEIVDGVAKGHQKEEDAETATALNIYTMGGYRPRRVSLSIFEQLNAAAAEQTLNASSRQHPLSVTPRCIPEIVPAGEHNTPSPQRAVFSKDRIRSPEKTVTHDAATPSNANANASVVSDTPIHAPPPALLPPRIRTSSISSPVNCPKVPVRPPSPKVIHASFILHSDPCCSITESVLATPHISHETANATFNEVLSVLKDLQKKEHGSSGDALNVEKNLQKSQTSEELFVMTKDINVVIAERSTSPHAKDSEEELLENDIRIDQYDSGCDTSPRNTEERVNTPEIHTSTSSKKLKRKRQSNQSNMVVDKKYIRKEKKSVEKEKGEIRDDPEDEEDDADEEVPVYKPEASFVSMKNRTLRKMESEGITSDFSSLNLPHITNLPYGDKSVVMDNALCESHYIEILDLYQQLRAEFHHLDRRNKVSRRRDNAVLSEKKRRREELTNSTSSSPNKSTTSTIINQTDALTTPPCNAGTAN